MHNSIQIYDRLPDGTVLMRLRSIKHGTFDVTESSLMSAVAALGLWTREDLLMTVGALTGVEVQPETPTESYYNDLSWIELIIVMVESGNSTHEVALAINNQTQAPRPGGDW